MGKAARAIIIENNALLVMQRKKTGDAYYTLVGGLVSEDETLEQALRREVLEETGLQVISEQLVYIEEHRAPANQQYIYLCTVAPHGPVSIQESAKESFMNSLDINIHTPQWVSLSIFSRIPFRSPQLQTAILDGLKRGFPRSPITL